MEFDTSKVFHVLDHGFIRVVDIMGDDTSIVQAARVSYGDGTKHVSQDRALIRYLMRHKHTSPFEMCEIKLHLKMPIFVARQWIRHRTASINEYSARYSISDNKFYIPNDNSFHAQSIDKKQSRDLDSQLELDSIKDYSEKMQYLAGESYQLYQKMIDDGVAREIARISLPVCYYTEIYWKIDLHNLLHFLRLRCKENAQYEIREYANTILEKIVKVWVPHAYSAFMDYSFNSVLLSKQCILLIKKVINKEKISFEESDISKSEWNEFCDIFELDK